jgi:hypothetical protein
VLKVFRALDLFMAVFSPIHSELWVSGFSSNPGAPTGTPYSYHNSAKRYSSLYHSHN